jgi:hypothetical protein
MNILNIINQFLGYDDPVVTDNPQLRSIDWSRRINGISIDKPIFDQRTIEPGGSFTVFDGSRSTSLNGSSILSISLVSSQYNRYRVSVTSGPSGFRTARAVSGITTCSVTVNNNAIASFSFSGAALTGVVVGDTMRINGALSYDTGPYAFSGSNAGLWTILAVSGTTVQASRPVGQAFNGVTESVAVATNDVQFYSASGVQIGDSVAISGTFSSASQRTYSLAGVTPNTFDFISAMPLPIESGLTYAANSLAFYIGAKHVVYLECDQDAVVRFNEDSSDNNKVTPILVGDPSLIGYLSKYGETYRMTVVNKSVNPLNIKYFLAE